MKKSRLISLLSGVAAVLLGNILMDTTKLQNFAIALCAMGIIVIILTLCVLLVEYQN